jgi:hypothetical protein
MSLIFDAKISDLLFLRLQSRQRSVLDSQMQIVELISKAETIETDIALLRMEDRVTDEHFWAIKTLSDILINTLKRELLRFTTRTVWFIETP